MPKKHKWKRTRIGRVKELANYLSQKYEPKCWMCKKDINIDDIRQDKWTRHHMDECREHNDISNLVLVHRGCHRKHHQCPDKKNAK